MTGQTTVACLAVSGAEDEDHLRGQLGVLRLCDAQQLLGQNGTGGTAVREQGPAVGDRRGSGRPACTTFTGNTHSARATTARKTHRK